MSTTTALPPPSAPSVTEAALKCIPARPKNALAAGVSPMSATATDASSIASSDSISPSPVSVTTKSILQDLTPTLRDAGNIMNNAMMDGLNATEGGLMKMIGGKTRQQKAEEDAATKMQAMMKGKQAREVVAQMKFDDKVPACFSLVLKALGCQKPALKA